MFTQIGIYFKSPDPGDLQVIFQNSIRVTFVNYRIINRQ
ncbi:hypothetical protein J2T02_003335 [Chitinophaga terrae (ex Kim and Jung 2007)]|nr:hypothetical protein [Chitinophaga terrae (ex Kim and Jung 2007)]